MFKTLNLNQNRRETFSLFRHTTYEVRNISYEFINKLYKTNPIFRNLKVMQTKYLKRIMKIYCPIRAQKTNPIKANQTQFKPNYRKDPK
jgi:hypothetical protein